MVKNPPASAGDMGLMGPRRSPGIGNATHSSMLAWKISRTEEPGGYSPWRRKRVRYNSAAKQQQQGKDLLGKEVDSDN